MNYYLAVFNKYAVFSGRASRVEYWYFNLFNIIVYIVLSIVLGVAGTEIGVGIVGLLIGIYSLAVLIPSFAVTIRRLHDTNRSGWWMFISVVPLIGGIWFLVLMIIDGTPEENQYGSNPKNMTIK